MCLCCHKSTNRQIKSQLSIIHKLVVYRDRICKKQKIMKYEKYVQYIDIISYNVFVYEKVVMIFIGLIVYYVGNGVTNQKQNYNNKSNELGTYTVLILISIYK